MQYHTFFRMSLCFLITFTHVKFHFNGTENFIKYTVLPIKLMSMKGMIVIVRYTRPARSQPPALIGKLKQLILNLRHRKISSSFQQTARARSIGAALASLILKTPARILIQQRTLDQKH